MEAPATRPRFTKRYELVTREKSGGSTYTPPELADFVARQMLREWIDVGNESLRILDPAVGEGELLASLLKALPCDRAVEVYGFDNDQNALQVARTRLAEAHPNARDMLSFGNFLEVVCGKEGEALTDGLFSLPAQETFDLVIANPPYVRTQIMGANVARALASQFDLKGRVDLYHAFVLGIAKVLRPHGVAGIIVSNRFMSTKSGACVRRAVRHRLHLNHVWDFGDTKLFDAAVLPAVLVAEGLNGQPENVPRFSSIYETARDTEDRADTVTDALEKSGVIEINDGRRFHVQHGVLDSANEDAGVWRLATEESNEWLATVDRHTWGTFRTLGKVRVGVKTCADRVFIGHDWDDVPTEERPELLRPLTTHHIGRRFRADVGDSRRWIIYPHERVNGKRQAVNLDAYPKTKKYLEEHREKLEGRSYVLEAGRQWYEIWVPQEPSAWERPKLVFRDISEEPCFWIDLEGSIVNGDCYWLICDKPRDEELLWLAASVGNSTFIEAFYDRRFNNKLYAGRRRFITQYVEKFPIPDPTMDVSKRIIETAKRIYDVAGTIDAQRLESELDSLVWSAFGLSVEEVSR